MAALTTGNILVVSDQNDVTTGLAAEISAVDGSTVQTLSMPFANRGAILPSGVFCLAVETIGDDPLLSFAIYSNTGTLIATVTSPITDTELEWNCPVYAWGADTFYILASPNAAGAPTLYTISDAGVIGAQSWLLPAGAQSARAIAISDDGSILYYVHFNGNAINRYDLIGEAPLSDLIDNTDFAWGYGLFFDPDGNVVAMGIDNSNLDNVVVISTSGAVVNTYPFDLDNYEIGELFSDTDPAFIWIRSFPDGSGATSSFRRVELATGTAVVTFTVDTLEGTGDVPETCPVLLLRVAGGGGGSPEPEAEQIIGPLAWVHWPRLVPGNPPGSP